MSSISANVEHITNKGIGKTRGVSKKPRHFAKRIVRLLSVDADNFCDSKDWPYLWSAQHKENRK